eukprot:CAMPEP_0201869040 /NCGR_PEP_ID=MMETSP0902-20130614/2705_1 /ASSEMBLY_ACC=CAM_ASM_000551 /TAXON_ID=420261 /ORGANISM="Thalassiosira antarctica, Strain CCMP982" /LENGTH=945 /DNA_ID=CAMNT_0048394477 /DNA_START=47 /DNA_END=2884 /DNA_ORIENTATION=+
MKISTSAIIALGGTASCSAFLSPYGKQPLRIRPGGYDQFQPSLHDIHLPAAAAAPRLPRGDVSVGFFRDLVKKFKGDDDGEEDKAKDESSGVDADPTSTLLVVEALVEADANKEEKTDDSVISTTGESVDQEATPFFATSEEGAADAETTPIESKEEEVVPPIESKEEEVIPPIEYEEEEVPEPTEAETPPIEIKEEEVAEPVEQPAVKAKEEELSPMDQVEKLRAQAARVRLEADKQQVELTLQKIAKLNGKLELLKNKDTVDAKDQQSLEEELQRLKAQLITDEKGEIKPVAAPVAAKSQSAASSTVSQSNKIADTTLQPRTSLSAEDMKERVKQFQEAPEFMKVLVAKTIGFGVDGDTPGAVDRLNATDIVQKLYDDEIDYESITSDFPNDAEQEKVRESIERAYKNSNDMTDDDKPVFTKEQIQAKVDELDDVPKFFKDIISKEFNNTETALMLLEQEYEDEKRKKKGGGFFSLFGDKDDDKEKGEIGRDGERMDREKSGTFSQLFSDEPKGETDLTFMMESLYPKSTRKEDEAPDKRQVDAFLNDVVAATKAFTPSADPVSVPGGWIIRGKNECESGDELIDKLDGRIANDARLREKISFFVLKDPFPNSEEILDPLNWPEVLFVAGPDVARDSQPILRTAISSIGIATVWYGSIAPFLANSKLLDRATEGMELADAGMQTDLTWLSEMSIPLFLTFFALQVVHEVAHQAVAKSRNFEVTIPTFVPSIMSGITSSITSLKTSPKNKQDLVEFAVAGPLAGMIASIAVLCYGLDLTASADLATVQSFPGLPLAILRQSTLGGGLIDIFLGNGVLSVPASAEAAQALASTMISLHPLAVAGFVSLLVNAFALVPAGRTDGGRISMALFGRSGSQAVTFISLASLFILGWDNDLILFYFAFIVFCQSELEIPMRNEVDNVDVTRFALASFAGFLMLLSIIPMN